MRLFAGTPWDTEPVCDQCQQPIEKCECPPDPSSEGFDFSAEELLPGNQQLRLSLEKRKKGKQVTVIRGLKFADQSARKKFLSELKSVCGTGGKVTGETLEFQGDLVERLESILDSRGYRVRRK